MAGITLSCRCRTSPCSSSAACGPSTTSASMLTRRRSLALSALTARAKTTLFNVITANYKPTSGSVTLAGTSLRAEAQPGGERRIARTFQNIRLFNSMTVLENVMVGLDRASRYSLLEAALHIGRYFSGRAGGESQSDGHPGGYRHRPLPICRPQT